MKIDRLLGIVTILSNQDKVKAKYLSEKFEVSIRTIYRDIDDICKSGIPIVTYQGVNGGVSILKGYKLDKNILTENELESMIIGLKGIKSMKLDSKVDILFEKLYPTKKKIMVAEDIIIDLSYFQQESIVNKLSIIRAAIKNKKIIEFNYYSKAGIYKKNVEPNFVIFRNNSWYISGFCSTKQDFRLFKLTRISQLVVLNFSFEPKIMPKEKIKKKDYLCKDKKVTLLMDRSLEYKLVDYIDDKSYEITKSNKIKVDMPYIDYDFIIELILSMGDKVEVLSPKYIRNDIQKKIYKIIKLYKKT